jgi:hypothetical protein
LFGVHIKLIVVIENSENNNMLTILNKRSKIKKNCKNQIAFLLKPNSVKYKNCVCVID